MFLLPLCRFSFAPCLSFPPHTLTPSDCIQRYFDGIYRHWVDKNCINWAKTYFETELSGVAAEANGASVKTLAVTSVTGDVDVNQRKGKIITIFDVAITMTFEGTLEILIWMVFVAVEGEITIRPESLTNRTLPLFRCGKL